MAPLKYGLANVVLMAASFTLLGCGGNGGAGEGGLEQQAEGSGVSEAPPPSEPAGEPGFATVRIGDDTYEFEVRCMFGTMGVQGSGTRADGQSAYLVATFDPDKPEDSDIDIRVGTDRMGGPATQKWIAGDTYGNSAGVAWEGDARSVSGSAPFRDRESDVLVDGRFREVPGEFQVDCPGG